MNDNKKQSNREEEISKIGLHDAADPRDGVRLIRAFLEIKEPAWREKLIHLAEDLAKASSDCLGTAEVGRTTNARSVVSTFLRTPAEDDAPVPAEIP